MFNNLIVLIAVAVTMVACSDTQIKQAAVARPASATSITFQLLSDNWVEGTAKLAVKDKRGCGTFANDIFPPAADQDFTVAIEGNNDIFFHLTRANSVAQCDFVRMFYATKGKEYLLNVYMKEQNCKISLIEKSANGEQHEMNTYPAYVSRVDGVAVCENKDKLYN